MGLKFPKKFQTPVTCTNKTPRGSLDDIFLHKPCKFEQNRSIGTREILTTARGQVENGLPAKTT